MRKNVTACLCSQKSIGLEQMRAVEEDAPQYVCAQYARLRRPLEQRELTMDVAEDARVCAWVWVCCRESACLLTQKEGLSLLQCYWPVDEHPELRLGGGSSRRSCNDLCWFVRILGARRALKLDGERCQCVCLPEF